jgi:ABC-type transporter MlaC component
MQRSPVPAWLPRGVATIRAASRRVAQRTTRYAACAAFAAALTCAATATAQDAAPPTPAANPNEAIERVVSHIEALTQIIEANADLPDKAIADFEAYLTQNAQAMRDANAAIEAKLKSLPADESQSYQEGMQRRLEDPLRKFMTAMLNFGRKHPEQAKALDEKLQRASL